MSGKAGQSQPDGQVPPANSEVRAPRTGISRHLWLGLALVLLTIPFNRGGLWDPYELRNAELGRRLAHQLFHSDIAFGVADPATRVTATHLGQGELGITSPALGFALLGVSDWAGRLTSLVWGAIAVGSLWLLMGRLAGRLAQVLSVLVLVTIPLFGWQARTMLGDAATIGTLAAATAGLALLQFDRQVCPERSAWRMTLLYAVMATLGLGAGVLCRGVVVGVAVPCLSVGLVSLLYAKAWGLHWPRRLRAALLIGIGIAAAVVGIREAQFAPKGFSFWLGATLSAPVASSAFDLSLSNILHQAFPLSAFLPTACAVAVKRSRRSSSAEQPVALVLVLTIVLSIAAAAMSAKRGVTTPFAAVAALAGVSGVALAKLHREGGALTLVGAFTLTVAVLLFADFINFPDKVLLTAGVLPGRSLDSFARESRNWLRVVLAILVAGCVVVALSNVPASTRTLGVRARYRRLFEGIRLAYGGQLIGGFVLVETAMVTTSLLQRAHDQGWITVPAFDAVRTLVGPLLTWVWLAPPAVVFAIPLGYATVELVAVGLTSKRLDKGRLTHSRLARALLGDTGSIRAGGCYRLTPGLWLAVTLIVAGLVMSIGHATAMAEQVSPKRAIAQYRSHAKPDEPLGLLGIKAEAVNYYLGELPQTWNDIEAAANWLQASGARRRWLAFPSDRLAELNAAFRAASSRRNLAIVDPMASNVLVATDRLVGSERDFNPLSVDVLAAVPRTSHQSSIEFGNAIRLVGWDIKSDAGASATRLGPGKIHELQLVFEVLGTTSIDWEVFVHIDGRGRRHNGDHEPLGGRYPTTLWQPGDVLVDRHQVVLETGALPGAHTLFVGLFRGNKRLEVTAGQHDDNRVPLGELEVR